MTRDQAIKILSRIWGGDPQHFLAQNYADAFIALGMLKVDEPAKYSTNLIMTVRELRLIHHETYDFLDALEDRGLKIVEK